MSYSYQTYFRKYMIIEQPYLCTMYYSLIYKIQILFLAHNVLASTCLLAKIAASERLCSYGRIQIDLDRKFNALKKLLKGGI